MHLAQTLTRMRLLLPMKMQSRTTFLPHSWKSLKEISLTVQDKCGYECYDIVCANILADVLEPLSAEITQHMKHGAYFITSGIINTKEQEVVDAFKKNPELEIVEVNHDGEWVNVTARRR